MLIERAMISDFLKESGVDAAFIEKDENCRYISGFTGSDSYLFLTADDCYLLTDSRYTEQAKEEAKGFTIIDYAENWRRRWESFLQSITSLVSGSKRA